MSRILILANSSAGFYDFRIELAHAMMAEGHKVMISLPDTVKTGQIAEEGVEVIHTSINRRGMNPVQDAALLRSYRKLMREKKPDLVLTYTIKPNVYGGLAAASLGIPSVASVTGLGSAFQQPGLKRTLVTLLYRAGLRKARCVFFQNAENMGIFDSFGIKGESSRLVPGSGVDLNTHGAEPYPEDGQVRFLFVGRMMKEKGIEEYLAAAAKLHSDRVVFQTVGYCDEDYQAQLDAAEARGEIAQLGFQTEMHSFYTQCSAAVMPTYHEGMSNVLMEASSTARPVIASRISGCREIVDEGSTGFLFEPRNAGSLIEALEKFIALPVPERASMGRNARAKMEREFDRRTVTAAYMEEIHGII